MGQRAVPLATDAHFADRDPLSRLVLERMLAGVSARRFARTREPVGEAVSASEHSTSKSTVSREFVARTGEHLAALMARSLSDVHLAALMLDGIELKGRCCVVALGVSTEGVKIPLGLWDGSTENKTVTVHLLADLVERGLNVEQGVLVVLDGGKALRAAVNEVFGAVPVLRCVRHYAEVRVMPSRVAEAGGGGRIRLVGVRIITAPRGRRGACRVAGSGRAWCREVSSSRARLP
jgi:putative transposase